MHITFGMYLDGTTWSGETTSSGRVQTGPQGLLSILETHLGLTGLHPHPARRIRQYMQRMKDSDVNDPYYGRSFADDPWSTAKHMLALRDQLIAGGWNGAEHPSFTPRLQALAKLEQEASPLAPGMEDRLLNVLRLLSGTGSVPVSSIESQEPTTLLPPLWRRLLESLAEIGVRITDPPEPLIPAPATNLQKIQLSFMGGPDILPLAGEDDTLLLLNAGDEWEAAEIMASWLRARSDGNKSVAIIASGDTGVIDAALHRHGLPRLGNSTPSRWRGVLQVLPLVLANAWLPLDIRHLAELLSLPQSPIHPKDARRLLRALREDPGVGGKEWREALADIAEQAAKRAEENDRKNPANAGKDAAALLDAMLVTDRHSPDAGIPESALIARCGWVLRWLNRKIESGALDEDDERIHQEARAQAQEFAALVTGSGTLTRVAVGRIMESVIGTGTPAVDSHEEAAPWSVLRHPGQLTRRVDTLLWWDFSENKTSYSTYWTGGERTVLKDLHVELPDEGQSRLLEAFARRRGIGRVTGRMMLFHPEKKHGEECFLHPFWDEVIAGASRLAGENDFDADATLVRHGSDILTGSTFVLAGRQAPLEAVRPEVPAVPREVIEVDAASIELREHLSYSQMKNMISCPARWVMDKHLGLRSADVRSLSTGNKMIGSLCHRIVEELYREAGARCDENVAERKAAELYERLVPELAAELLAEDRRIEYVRYRRDVSFAVRNLVSRINQLGLIVESTEEVLDAPMGEVSFTGRVDMLLRTRTGEAFVLDFKWTGQSKYLRADIEQGAALQLATYAWLLHSRGENGDIHTGYFMLVQGELLSTSGLLGEAALHSPSDLEEVWNSGRHSWEEDYRMLKSGTLSVRGVTEARIAERDGLKPEKVREDLQQNASAVGRLYLKPCAFCDFGILCGMKEGAV